jgi:DNA-binding transcriptional MerR regulator
VDEKHYTATGIATRLARLRGLADESILLRTVRYWASTGLLKPTGRVFTGKGKNRIFAPQEFVRAEILLELSRWGAPVGILHAAMKALSALAEHTVKGDDLVLLMKKHASGLLIFEGKMRPDGELEIHARIREKVTGIRASALIINLAVLRPPIE